MEKLQGLAMVAGQSYITSPAVFPLHLTRHYPFQMQPIVAGLRSRGLGEFQPSRARVKRSLLVWQARHGLVYDTLS